MYMKDTLDGDSNTSIRFTADVIVYNHGEIINGCTIIKKEPNGIVHAKSEYAGLQLSIQNNMVIFKEGDVVPVRVKRVRYNVNQSAISVSAMPFIPIPYSHIYYRHTSNLDKQHIKELRVIVHDIESILKEFTALSPNKKKIHKFFIDLLFNKSDKNTIPNNSEKLSMSKILTIAEGSGGPNAPGSGITYMPNGHYDDMTVYRVAEDDAATVLEKTASQSEKLNIDVIEESSYLVLYNILLTQLSRVQTIKNFIEFYPDFNAVQKNKEIWKLYSMLKK